LELVEWEQADTNVRIKKEDGRNEQDLLMAARAEITQLEEVVLETEKKYVAVLDEVSGLTTVTTAAKADSLRLEQEVEMLRKQIAKIAAAAQEQIDAVEDKYACLQELQSGLLLELQNQRKRGTGNKK
jgi:hypothetical protein